MTTEELARLFQTFTASAFRLECLPSYDVTEDAEREAFRRFLSGEPQPSQDREWPELVASAVAAGKSMQRVRMVESPPTDYQRFEMEWGYPANVAEGESILILDHRPDGLLVVDFWLFDDATVVVLEYDDEGRFVRPVAAETVEPYRQARDAAIASAVPFRAYQTRLRAGTTVGDHIRNRLSDAALLTEIARLAFRPNRPLDKRG